MFCLRPLIADGGATAPGELCGSLCSGTHGDVLEPGWLKLFVYCLDWSCCCLAQAAHGRHSCLYLLVLTHTSAILVQVAWPEDT
jgi:hypothetical protein